MRKTLYLVALAAFMSWIAIAEIIAGNTFLALNTIAGALFIMFSPWLFELADTSPLATDDEPSSSSPPGSAFVASAAQPFAGDIDETMVPY